LDFVPPMLRERDGWAAFVSTPRGKNHLHEAWETAGQEGWFRNLTNIRDAGLLYKSTKRRGEVINADQMMDEERADGMLDALIRQEYLCDWSASNVGSVYVELLEGIEPAEFTPDEPRVFTSWDLGGAGMKGDATAVWIWAATEDGVDLLDYFEGQGKPLSYYHDEVDKRLADNGWQPIRHWLPFDAASSYLTGQVYQQCIEHWGSERVAIAPKRGILDGVQAGRWLLQQKIRVHPSCKDGLLALRAYHYVWDEERKTLSNMPEHDWSSHCSDSFRYLACVAKFSDQITRKPAPAPPVDWERKPTFNDAVREYQRTSKGKARPYVPPEGAR